MNAIVRSGRKVMLQIRLGSRFIRERPGCLAGCVQMLPKRFANRQILATLAASMASIHTMRIVWLDIIQWIAILVISDGVMPRYLIRFLPYNAIEKTQCDRSTLIIAMGCASKYDDHMRCLNWIKQKEIKLNLLQNLPMDKAHTLSQFNISEHDISIWTLLSPDHTRSSWLPLSGRPFRLRASEGFTFLQPLIDS